LGISALLLLRTAGSSLLAIDVRYLAFLVPCALVVIAAAIDGMAQAIEWAAGRARRLRWPAQPSLAAPATVLLVGLLMVQALPALAASYQAPKDDWKGAAQHIAAASPAGAVVLAVGDYSDWSVICLDYYFKRFHDPITVIDAKLVDSGVAAQLAATNMAIWGVVVYPSAEQAALLDQRGSEQTDFVDVTGHVHVVHATDQTQSVLEQARTLLHWEATVQPQSDAVAKLLDLYTGNARLGPDLLPQAPTGWTLQAGVGAQSGTVSFTTTKTAAQLTATASAAIEPGQTYVVSFDCYNAALAGDQTVFLSALDRQGNTLSVFPSAGGYLCAKSVEWSRSYFAFTAPPSSSLATLLLRTGGSGTAEFTNVALSRI
jgi:hypothetical protein